MSDLKAPPGPRSNPLYGGPPAQGAANGGGRTPSWARRGAPSPARNSAFSDVASTPPDSPAREHFGAYTPAYEDPGYTVETPGHSEVTASPYHAPPYYVQTPLASDGIGSPLSSAPSSPSQFGPNGMQYGTQDSRGSRGTLAKPRVSRFGQQSIMKIDEEEEEFPDLERDHDRFTKRWTGIIWITLILLVFIIGLGLLIVWLLYRPTPPRYQFQGIEVNRLEVHSSNFDANGITTSSIYGNITVFFEAHNPNDNYGMGYTMSAVQFGYLSLPVLMAGTIPAFKRGANDYTNFTANAVAWNAPLYGAGPYLEESVASGQLLPLKFNAIFNSRVEVVWKIIKQSFARNFTCTITLNTTTLYMVNNTCARGFV